jgi:hypothetical protein
LDQLNGELRNAVLNTAGTLVSFRVGYHDAVQLAREIFPAPDYIKRFKSEVSMHHSRIVPLPFVSSKNEPLGWDGLALELANLKPRQFWFRKRGPNRPVKQHSFDMPDPELTPRRQANVQALRAESGRRYGVPRSELKSHMGREAEAQQTQTDIPTWSE